MAKEITKEDIFDSLVIKEAKIGDIIINKGSESSYVVTEVGNNTLIAVRTIIVTNEPEWFIIKK